MGLKENIIGILAPIFGNGVKGMIESYYDENNPQELYDLVHHMLSGVIGQKSTEALLKERLNLEKPLINKNMTKIAGGM